MIAKEIYSILFLATCGLTVACLAYAIHGGFRTRLNRLFLLMGCGVIVWSFGLAITAAGWSEKVSLLGRRIAPLGWGALTGVAVHFVLALTGHEKLLKKWWIYPALYLPSAVNLAAYAFLPLVGVNPDHQVYTRYGWVSATALDGWDWFFNLYSLTFIAIAAALLTRWGRRSPSQNVKRQARTIAVSFLSAVILVTLADIGPSLMGFMFPQVSSIFMTPLVCAVAYCIERYHFLQPEAVGQDEVILSGAARTHVYKYLGLSILAGGLVLAALAPRLPLNPEALPAAWVEALMFSIAAFLLLVDRLRLGDKPREMLVSASFAFLVPLISLWFAASNIFATWGFGFPLMIVCLLFNRRILLATLIASLLLTQLFQWAYLPEASLTVSTLDFGLRLGSIALAALFSIYVNRVYTSRLRENVNHADMQRIASEISHNFVSIGEQNIGEKLYATLERCGKFIQCDRAYLVLLNPEDNSARYAVEWVSGSVLPPRDSMDDAMRGVRPELMKRLEEKTTLVIRDTLLLPPMAAQVKKHMLSQGIRGLVTVAVKDRGEVIGFLGFSASRPVRAWNLDSTAFIEIIADIVTDAVLKVNGERELSRMAYYDQLTGLPNRILFKERLSQAIQEAQRAEKMVGVAFLDLDAFKSVNDTLGHDQGDRLLGEVARSLSGAIRGYDVAARFGGDEFVMMFGRLSSQLELVRIMDRLIEVVQKPVVLAGQEFFVSVSAGVALYPQDGADPEALMKNADTAMYSAKRSGKGRYVMCSQDMKDVVQEKIRLTNLLYRALEKEQLLLHYQPQVDVRTHAIVGVEALLRWKLPDRGMISPATFIPLAEQTGLIHAIGEWVLLEACRNNQRWQRMGCEGLRMAVNVSVHQLRDPNFAQKVGEALRKTGLAPECLELEITESAANGNADGVVAILKGLKALGVSISIDDFGTEYSSLSRLKLLPVDRIKMDMQFVHGIEKNEKDKAITKIIINLAKSLQLKVIAEGVETAPQLDFLRNRMCDEVQGYYYYKPMPAEELEKVLLRQLEARRACL